MREFGVYISVLEPGPVRTAFFANVGGHVDNVSDDDPYANSSIDSTGEWPPSAQAVSPPSQWRRSSARSPLTPSPALRYQSSDQSRAIAAQKLVDPTGRSILAATGTMLHP
jgi:short-subunit dehydrogenase